MDEWNYMSSSRCSKAQEQPADRRQLVTTPVATPSAPQAAVVRGEKDDGAFEGVVEAHAAKETAG